MTNMFNYRFLFNFRPGALSHNSLILMGTFIVLMAALFTFLKIMKDKGYSSRMWQGISDFAFTNALLACLLVFFATEFVPFFSARFWVWVWLIEMALWINIIVKRKNNSKQNYQKAEKDKIDKKYLPK